MFANTTKKDFFLAGSANKCFYAKDILPQLLFLTQFIICYNCFYAQLHFYCPLRFLYHSQLSVI